MTNEVRAEKLLEGIRQAWLCRIGYHGQPLSRVEATVLNKIILQTGVVTLILKLWDVFDAFPIDVERAEELIGTIESLGVRPTDQAGELELLPNSPLDEEISTQIVGDERFTRLAAYVTTPDFASETNVGV